MFSFLELGMFYWENIPFKGEIPNHIHDSTEDELLPLCNLSVRLNCSECFDVKQIICPY